MLYYMVAILGDYRCTELSDLCIVSRIVASTEKLLKPGGLELNGLILD